MHKGLLTATVLLLVQALSATAAEPDAGYREALLKELNNRKLASLERPRATSGGPTASWKPANGRFIKNRPQHMS
jgi:hypothetical protein